MAIIITFFTVVIVYFLDKWENKYIKSLFDWVPAILLAYLIPAIASILLNKDFSQVILHDYSKHYFIPLAIITVMSSLSIVQLKAIGWKPIILFVSGSFWIALFPVFLIWVFLDSNFISEVFVQESYWKGLPPIVGSWIGGSTSQLVLKEIVECPEHIFLSVLVLDNILVNIWTILMFQTIKKSKSINRWLNIKDENLPERIINNKDKSTNPLLCVLILVGIVLATNFFIETFIVKVVLLSIIGLIISNLVKNWNYRFVLKLGGILIILVMAILGLKLKFDLIKFETSFFIFLTIWLISHFFIMLFLAKQMNINFAWVPIASMANVGGIATAPAVTAAYEKKWMPHAIVLAVLSMATGTFWGMLTIYLLEVIVL